MLVHWTKLIFCHCQVALCKLFTFIIISVHKRQFMKFQIEDIRRGGAKINFIFEWWKHYFTNERMVYIKSSSICSNASKMAMGSKGGAVVRALASHRCGPRSNPGIDSIYRLSLMLVLSFFRTGVSPGRPLFTSP